MSENQNPKLQEVKNYLKQQIYKELKEELAKEFEERFIITLEETVKMIVAQKTQVTVKEVQGGFETVINCGGYYGALPVVTPHGPYQRPLSIEQKEEIYSMTTAIVLEKIKQQDLLKQMMAADEADGLYKETKDESSI